MKTRELRPSDISFVERWHKERGLNYKLPKLFVRDNDGNLKLANNIDRAEILENDDGQPISLMFGVRTSEMYFLGDPKWATPRKRLMAFTLLHESIREWFQSHGIEDVFAVLPPGFERFGKRLSYMFGWNHGDWDHYSRKTAGER